MSTTQYSERGALLGSAEASVTVANSTDITTLGSSITIPADTLNDGDVIQGYLAGQYSTTGTPTLTFTLRNGTTALLAAAALTTGSGVSSQPLWIEYIGTVRSTGATGTIMWAMKIYGHESTIRGVAADVTADTVDLTADITLNLAVTWSAASASNTITASQHVVKKA